MNREELMISELYDLQYTMAAPLFGKFRFPWEVLPEIGNFIMELGSTLPADEYQKIGDSIWIHKSVSIPPTASLTGPLIICEGAEVRQCAFFRGKVLVGKNAVTGNSCEFKNCILFDRVQTPHYNYVGDSVLGYRSHMGAASLTSNVKSDKKPVVVHTGEEDIETGFKKFGAMIGDEVEVGCGSVLNPGTVIGKHTNIYPLSSVRGCVPAFSIWKREGEIVLKA
jgi:NDP-sugar pyrophosphorylase family protein